MKVLLAEINMSEGTNQELIDQVTAVLKNSKDIEIVDLNSNSDHNRTVYTFRGEPKAVLEAAKNLSRVAIELIDMTKHQGSHPRMGAVDVAPFIPVREVTIEEALEVAREYGKFLGCLGVPVYYYEDAATADYRKSLVSIRKGEYEGLQEKMKDSLWIPDEGPKEFVPKSGATVTGVRFPLVAFNVNLKTEDIDIGKKIVKAIRGATGGYQYVRAIALPLEGQGMIQVSMNLVNYEKTPISRVFETVKAEAESYGVLVGNTELVGPVPVYAFEEVLRFYLRVKDFSSDQIYM